MVPIFDLSRQALANDHLPEWDARTYHKYAACCFVDGSSDLPLARSQTGCVTVAVDELANEEAVGYRKS